MTSDAEESPTAHPEERRSPLLRRLVVLAVCVVLGWLLLRFVGTVDWRAVQDALSKLTPSELLVLVALLLVRQFFNALPLALFIPGLGVVRALVNDLTAHLIAIAAPPPSDLVLRLRMFASWGIERASALAGTVANTIAYYTTRFAVPLVGSALMLVTRQEPGPVLLVLASTAVAAAIVLTSLAAVRREDSATAVGHAAGRAARRVRSSVDPDAWSRSATDFRNHVHAGFRSHLGVSLAGLVVMVLVDATIVLLALRFVGVPADQVPAVEVYATFCFVYPLTVFPLMGLGVLDGFLLAAVIDRSGMEVEAAAVAGLVVWRAVTLIGPVLLGALALAAYKVGLVAAPEDAEPRA